jgi:putative transposase
MMAVHLKKKEISMKGSLAKKLWPVVEPILQSEKKKIGRPGFDVYKTFEGVLFILESGSKWRQLPKEFGKTSTVHGKFMRWVRDGRIQIIFEIIRRNYIDQMSSFKNWYAVDTSYSKAPYALYGGKNPTDRGKRGVKKNLLIDSRGAPLVVSVGPANKHDSQTMMEILRMTKKIKHKGLVIVAVDSAYDSKSLRKEAAKDGFVIHAATNKRRNKNCPIVKPKGRWRVEATHSWLNNFRAVKTCYAKHRESFLAFLQIAAAVQLFRMV